VPTTEESLAGVYIVILLLPSSLDLFQPISISTLCNETERWIDLETFKKAI